MLKLPQTPHALPWDIFNFFDDDNDGCNDNHDDNYGNFDDDYDKND